MAPAVDVALTLVVPCYNEAHRLNTEAFRAFLAEEPLVSVIFVDDGSTDGTREMLEPLVRPFATRASVLVQPVNLGKAAAVREGMRKALADRAAVVGFWDADLSTPLDAVRELLDVLRHRPDIEWVFGSRVRLMGRSIERRALRHYLGRVFATATSLVLSLPVYDTQCGAKLFRATRELEAVLERPFVSRWVFDVEMISRFATVRRAGGGGSVAGAIYEWPLARWEDVGESKVRGLDFVRAFLDLGRVWLGPS